MFSPRQPFLQPTPICLCRGGPLAPRFSIPPRCHSERREGPACSPLNFELSLEELDSLWTVTCSSLSPFPDTLVYAVSPKFFVRHSYENTRDAPPNLKISSRFSAFSPLATRHSPLSPLESALTINAPITRLESALPKNST